MNTHFFSINCEIKHGIQVIQLKIMSFWFDNYNSAAN